MPYFEGAYSGVVIYPFMMDATGSAACDTFLNGLTADNQQDSVVAVNCFPTEFVALTHWDGTYGTFITDNPDPAQYPDKLNLTNTFKDPLHATQYLPKNNKMYTYPYMQIEVDCISSSKTFEPERFVLDTQDADSGHIGSARFIAYGCLSPDPEIVVVPQYYDGETAAVEHAQIVRGFPQFAYVIDSYRAWQALHTTQMQLATAAGMAAGVVGSAASLNPGGIISGVASIATYDERNRLEREKGDTVRGAQGSNGIVATRIKGIYFRQKGCTPEYARIIDDFFTKYGYSCGKVKVPNRKARPYFTFTKTQNCAVKGDVPASSLEKIRAIYNAGITFWTDATKVGNYSVDNSAPVPTP